MASLPCPACGASVEPLASTGVVPDACRACGQPLRIDYRHRLVECLGRSDDGTSAVYRAVTEPLGDSVSVLVCAADGGPRAQFIDGYQRFARLRHRCIANVYGIDEGNVAQHRPATVVLEWLTGGLLRERVRRSGPLGVPEISELLHGLLGALNLASTSLPPVAHGAISPDTIGFRGESPVPVLHTFDRGHAISWAGSNADVGQGAALGPHADVLSDLAAVGRVAAWAATQDETSDLAALTEVLDARLASIIDELRSAPQRDGYRSASAALGDLTAHAHPSTSLGAAPARHASARDAGGQQQAGFDPFARTATTGGTSRSWPGAEPQERSRSGGAGGRNVGSRGTREATELADDTQRDAMLSSQSATETSSSQPRQRRRGGKQGQAKANEKAPASVLQILSRLGVAAFVLMFMAPFCAGIVAELGEAFAESDASVKRVDEVAPASDPSQSAPPSVTDGGQPNDVPLPSETPAEAQPPARVAIVHEIPPFVRLEDGDVTFPLIQRTSGKVVGITGTIPHGIALAVDEACTVEIRSPGPESTFTCRLFVACGDPLRTYYGAGTAGYMPCIVENGQPVRGLDGGDDDGDPAFTFDLKTGEAEVSATLPEPWSVKIELGTQANAL